jgi:ribosomal protein L11 methyltransferase
MAARNLKPLWKVSAHVAAESEDAAAELLANQFGTIASVYADVETRETTASVYVPRVTAAQRAAVRDGLKLLQAAGLDCGPARVAVKKIRREDWAESWKRHFKPLEVSPRLLVKPSWIKRRPKRGQAVVILDPGLSFGTGQHPTTGFCLGEVARLAPVWEAPSIRPVKAPLALAQAEVGRASRPATVARASSPAPRSLLDAGCGSGILAIAAAKLGYSPVEAFDFDPEAVRVAKDNAAQNDVRVPILRRDLTRLPMRSSRQFDVVCANLIYDLLIAQRDKLLARLAPGGTLVLAGILREQFPAVRRAFEEAGLQLVNQRAGGEWVSGSFTWR